MKKKFMLSMSALLLSAGLLAGCGTGEEAPETEQPPAGENEQNTEQPETEAPETEE